MGDGSSWGERNRIVFFLSSETFLFLYYISTVIKLQMLDQDNNSSKVKLSLFFPRNNHLYKASVRKPLGYVISQEIYTTESFVFT